MYVCVSVSIELYSLKLHLVCKAEVTATCLQQQTSDVRVSMFAGAHQGCGALAVLGIYIRATAQEQLHHGNTAVAHCKHERRLACLGNESENYRELDSMMADVRA